MNNYYFKMPGRDELLNIFSISPAQAKKYRSDYIKRKIQNLEENLKIWFQKAKISRESEMWFVRDGICTLNNQINRLYRQVHFLKATKENGKNKRVDIDLIRAIPLKKILGEPHHSSYDRDYYSCPLHQEKNPSFVVYGKSNSWYCFSCCAGGSIIDLISKMYKLNIKETLKKLSYYV